MFEYIRSLISDSEEIFSRLGKKETGLSDYNVT